MLWGIACGTLAALMLGRAIQALLSWSPRRNRPCSPPFGVLVLTVAAVACLEPALRAARTPPLAALRQS